jgi:hypothetical protein
MLGLFADSRPSESSSRFKTARFVRKLSVRHDRKERSGASSGYVCDDSTVSHETRKQFSRIRELGTELFAGKGGAIREK